MTAALLWLQLAAAAVVILLVSRYLARSADVVAEKTGLGRSFIGVVMLATATSLPELGTGVSSIVLVGEPDLAAGDALGSNLVNLLIIGLLDLYWRNGPLLDAVATTSLLVAALGIAITSVAAIALFVHGATSTIAGWYVSPISVLMFLLFLVAMVWIYRHDAARALNEGKAPQDSKYPEESLPKAAVTYAISASVIIAAAVLLANTGDRLAEAMGWEASFVGTQFLAIATSLPELATSFAAIRLNAPDLALTNLLGSNVFNHGLVLSLDDVVYTDGVLWRGVSQVHFLSGIAAILMSGVVILGLMTKKRRWPGRYWTPEGFALVALYVAASVLVFRLA